MYWSLAICDDYISSDLREIKLREAPFGNVLILHKQTRKKVPLASHYTSRQRGKKVPQTIWFDLPKVSVTQQHIPERGFPYLSFDVIAQGQGTADMRLSLSNLSVFSSFCFSYFCLFCISIFLPFRLSVVSFSLGSPPFDDQNTWLNSIQWIPVDLRAS